MSTRLGIVGLGAVGGAFAAALARPGSGYGVCAWTRSYERREVWTRHPGVTVLEGPEEVARDADVLLLCVTDAAVGEVAGRCAVAAPGGARAALHTAGAVDPTPLAPLAAVGWATGVLHPLRPVVDGDEDALRGAAFGLFGDEEARAAARALALALGGRPVEIAADGAAQERYHGAAALLSNGLVGLFALAVDELEAAGASSDEAVDAARSLLERSAANLAARSTREALTGPLVRGDVARVEGHLAALSPAAADAYRDLSRRLLALVESDFEPARAQALRRLLEHG